MPLTKGMRALPSSPASFVTFTMALPEHRTLVLTTR
jgi:hypothetical protein